MQFLEKHFDFVDYGPKEGNINIWGSYEKNVKLNREFKCKMQGNHMAIWKFQEIESLLET